MTGSGSRRFLARVRYRDAAGQQVVEHYRVDGTGPKPYHDAAGRARRLLGKRHPETQVFDIYLHPMGPTSAFTKRAA